MSKNAGIFRNSLKYGASSLLLRGAGFLLLPVYSYYITANDFGVYSLLMAAYVILNAVVFGGIWSGFTKLYIEARTEEGRKSVVGFLLSLSAALAGIVIAATMLFSADISLLITGSADYARYIIILAFTLLLDSITTAGIQLLKTREEAAGAIRYSLLSGAINITTTLVFLIPLQMGIAGIFYAQLIAPAVVLLLLLPLFRSSIGSFSFKKMSRPVFSFLLPLIGSGVFGSATDFIDRFILSHYVSNSEVGMYSFTYRYALALSLFVISFRTAWNPRSLHEIYSPDYSAHFGRVFTKLLYSLLLLTILITTAYPYLFSVSINGSFLCNPKFETSAIVVLYITLGYVFMGLASFYSVYPHHSKTSYHFLWSDAVALAINVSCNILLIPTLKLRGAALATLLAYAACFIYLLILTLKHLKITYEFRKLILILLPTIIFVYAQLTGSGKLFSEFLLVSMLVIGWMIFRKSFFRIFWFSK